MKVKVYVDRDEKTRSLDVKSIKDIISKLELNEEEFIIVLNGELVTPEAKIKIGDDIKFLSVISGG